MKKIIIALIMVTVMIISLCAFGIVPVDIVPSNDETAIMYSKDGRSLEVPKNEVEESKKVGWFDNFGDVITTMWAEDGRNMVVYKDNIKDYSSVGWYENRDSVVTTVYKGDGDNPESKEVFKAEVEKYIADGWKSNKHNIDPNKPMVAMTFDDGPSSTTTPKILDAFEKYGGRGTFYLLGTSVNNAPDVIKRMKKMGCEIGSHTYDHSQLNKLPATKIKDQVDKTNAKINAVVGVNATTLRPPYGAINDDVKAQAGVPIALWSIDTLDWKSRNADSVYNVVMSTVKDGDIILMHDIYESSAAAAVRLIPALQQAGYQLVTVTELGEARGGIKAGQSYTDFSKQ
ncbi:MAG: polysaccharide deacetylase family protein [Oscillospiraceae bacterium]